jgi:hypothetical protein
VFCGQWQAIGFLLTVYVRSPHKAIKMAEVLASGKCLQLPVRRLKWTLLWCVPEWNLRERRPKPCKRLQRRRKERSASPGDGGASVDQSAGCLVVVFGAERSTPRGAAAGRVARIPEEGLVQMLLHWM